MQSATALKDAMQAKIAIAKAEAEAHAYEVQAQANGTNGPAINGFNGFNGLDARAAAGAADGHGEALGLSEEEHANLLQQEVEALKASQATAMAETQAQYQHQV